MRKTLILNSIIVIFVFTNCSKDTFTDDMPIIPSSIDVDINEDGVVDYKIEYRQGIVYSSTSDARISTVFNPIGKNEILHKEEEMNLFLRDLKNIQEDVEEPLFWNNKGFTEEIFSISNMRHGEWPTNWEVNSISEHSSYYLGLKIRIEDSIELGWVNLRFNTENGDVSVLDKGVFQ